MRFLLKVTLVLTLAACGKEQGKGHETRPSYDDLKAEAAANHELWKTAAPADFSYKTLTACYCSMPTYLITVQAGEIAKVERPQYRSDAADDADVTWEEVARDSDPDIKSIDQVFATVLEWADAQPDDLVVEFDPTYHFPTTVAMDYQESWADDEATLQVLEFTLPSAPLVE